MGGDPVVSLSAGNSVHVATLAFYILINEMKCAVSACCKSELKLVNWI